MSDVDLKNALLAGDPNAGDDTREVKTHAGVVVVRGLTRAEVLGIKAMRAKGDIDVAAYEAHIVSLALVSPPMTVEEVQRWQAIDKAGGALGDVTDAITELSGLAEGAGKSGV